MKKLLIYGFLHLLVTANTYSQIRVMLQGNRTVIASRVEFTKSTVFMDEYDKINSKVYEMDKSFVKSIIDANGRNYDFSSLISSKSDIENFKNSYNPNNATIVDSTKTDESIKEVEITKGEKHSTNLTLPMKDNRVFIEEIVLLKDSVKRNKIYVATKEWISNSFKSSKSVIDYEDKEEGKIICKGFFESAMIKRDKLQIKFTMDFTIKDNKYRIQMYNFEMQENHYDVFGLKLNSYYPSTLIDIDKMNSHYINNEPKPLYRRKYSEDIINKTATILQVIKESAKISIEKALLQKSSNDF